MSLSLLGARQRCPRASTLPNFYFHSAARNNQRHSLINRDRIQAVTMYALILTAEMNGVTSFRPKDSEASPFWYTFTVQCTSCRETHPKPVSVSRFEMNELSGSRGEANFVWKCKNCKRESSCSIKGAPIPYELSEPAKPQTLIEFDCRGLEFTSFSPEGEWLADGVESGTNFEGIDLQDDEWFEYDEKAGDEVSIKELKWEIRRA
ncbi:hypothetical protein F4861DRAFT_495311 [Xylaria intraflava]|nr:hypothetical protein F4861DRAFT_495311 [Xylaria intraflava]